MLIVKNVHSGYPTRKVLRGVSIEVNPGEIIALVGPNGAGKTTLMRTIIGLIPVSIGEISFLGREITFSRTDQMVHYGLAYVVEGVSFFPGLTVRENLFLASMGDKRETPKLMQEMLTLFPFLEKNLTKRADHLSGGEKRMLTLARGFMSDPRLIMLDDPFLGLSPKMVLSLCEFLRMKNKQGLSVLIAGQHVRRIIRMSNRTYLLEEGKITLRGEGVEFLKNHHFRERMVGLKIGDDLH